MTKEEIKRIKNRWWGCLAEGDVLSLIKEIEMIDDLLSRREALDSEPTRQAKISKAISVARCVDEAADKVKELQAELEMEKGRHSSLYWYQVWERADGKVAVLKDALKETMNEQGARILELEDKFPCGHRKIDWDDSYGECVACRMKEYADKFDDQVGVQIKLEEEIKRLNNLYNLELSRANKAEGQHFRLLMRHQTAKPTDTPAIGDGMGGKVEDQVQYPEKGVKELETAYTLMKKEAAWNLQEREKTEEKVKKLMEAGNKIINGDLRSWELKKILESV